MKSLFTFLAMATLGFQMQAQLVTVTGTVTDDTGMPLPGTNVIVKHTTHGTQTDFDGKYKIEAEIGQTLVFSYVGFNTEEVKINNAGIINVSMQTSAALEEVVVTGYAIQKRWNLFKRRDKAVPSGNVAIRGVSSIDGYGNYQHNNRVSENESYGRIEENIFKSVATSPLSTFSIDVDKAGYSNI